MWPLQERCSEVMQCSQLMPDRPEVPAMTLVSQIADHSNLW